MKLIAGLGNPGRQYAHTRHNVGFDALDVVAKRHNCRITGRDSRALVGKFDSVGEEIVLAKPQTFMNVSGESLAALVRKNRVKLDDLLVIYDDMDLPLGRVRIKPAGSSGGHNGMKSIIHSIGGSDFPRIRVGIGRSNDSIDHVLSHFSRNDRKMIDEAIELVADAVDMILSDGLDAAMNKYNTSQES